MKQGYVAILLDETGSMAGQEARVVTGINEYMNKLKGDIGDAPCRVALNLFDSERWREHYRGPLTGFPTMTSGDYHPGAMTPLYDAIAKTVSGTEADCDADNARVLIIIDTDGMENASVEVSRDTIFERIKAKEAEGWTFVFLGAEMEQFGGAYEAQVAMGLDLSPGNVRAMDHSSRAEMYSTAARASTSYLKEDSGVSDEEFWKRAEDEDKKPH